MKRRLTSVILFAVLAALASSTFLYRIISSNSPRAGKTTTTVLVATRDLDAGALVGETDLISVEWPVTQGSHWLVKRGDVVGRALLTPVARDEPFADSRLAAKGAAAGLASRIPQGMRAVAVHVDELTGLSRFILPGMHVDVISTGAQGGQSSQGMIARTILQNIEVFSTGDSIARDTKDKLSGAPVFNLLVSPQQAEVLSQAVAQTKIELVLRNPLDKDSILSEVIPAVHLPSLTYPKLPVNAVAQGMKRPSAEKKTVA
jgi:pilus assembly protein CpaB